eukprot:858450-Pelagomonas_calceolata.AAC.7
MLDIFEENDRRYLRHEMLGWYMPQNDSFALRQHLRPEHLRHNTPLPEITIQVCVWGGVVPEWQLRAAPAFEVRAPAAKHGPAGDHQTERQLFAQRQHLRPEHQRQNTLLPEITI